MFRRLFWIAVGVGIGFGVVWAVWRAGRRLSPDRLGRDLAAAVREAAGTVADALREGAAEARATEERLRAELAAARGGRGLAAAGGEDRSR